MIGKLKDLAVQHKLKVTFVGGVLVIASAYGSCSIDPDEGAIKDAVLGEEKPAEEPKKEEPKEEPKEEKEEPKEENEAKKEDAE